MTTKQIKFVRVLLYKEGISCAENDMALQFSNNRTKELKDLTPAETQALIEDLNGKSPKDKMVAKILSMAHEMKWKLPNGKVDMERINNWCIKHTSYHKPLDKLTPTELGKVVSIYQKIYKTFLKSL